MVAKIGSGVALASGLAAALIGLLDLLLLPAQKEQLKDRCIAAWLWLEDLNLSALQAQLRRRRIQSLIGVCGAVVAMLVWTRFVVPTRNQTNRSVVAFLVWLVIGLVWVYGSWHRRLLGWLFSRTSWLTYLAPLVLFTLAVWSATFVLGMVLVPAVSAQASASGLAVLVPLNHLASTCYMMAVCWSVILQFTLAVSVLWLAAMTTARIALKSFQFLLHRLIEYPKGIVLGVSLILVVLSALLQGVIRLAR